MPDLGHHARPRPGLRTSVTGRCSGAVRSGQGHQGHPTTVSPGQDHGHQGQSGDHGHQGQSGDHGHQGQSGDHSDPKGNTTAVRGPRRRRGDAEQQPAPGLHVRRGSGSATTRARTSSPRHLRRPGAPSEVIGGTAPDSVFVGGDRRWRRYASTVGRRTTAPEAGYQGDGRDAAPARQRHQDQGLLGRAVPHRRPRMTRRRGDDSSDSPTSAARAANDQSTGSRASRPPPASPPRTAGRPRRPERRAVHRCRRGRAHLGGRRLDGPLGDWARRRGRSWRWPAVTLGGAAVARRKSRA